MPNKNLIGSCYPVYTMNKSSKGKKKGKGKGKADAPK